MRSGDNPNRATRQARQAWTIARRLIRVESAYVGLRVKSPGSLANVMIGCDTVP
jgi:hypothetical protein